MDQGNNRIVRNKKGIYTTFGRLGSGDGQLDNPSCVRIVANKIHVSDTGNSRMQIFSMEGEFQKVYGADDKLIEPRGLASDGKHLFLADPKVGAVFVYSNAGQLLYKLTDGIESPIDLFFEKGKLYVADLKGATIKVFSNKIYQES